MATSDTQGQALDPVIRRIRSTGNIPVSPQLAHLHERIQVLQATLATAEAAQAANDHGQRTLPQPLTAASHHISLPPAIHSDPALPASRQPYPASNIPAISQQNQDGFDGAAVAPNAEFNPPSIVEPPHLSLMARLGLGSSAPRSRKIVSHFVWNMLWASSQFVVILTMLVLISHHWKSTTDRRKSEWTACDRPLGVWSSLWLVRSLCALRVTYSEYQQNRSRLVRTQDAESGNVPSLAEATARNLNTATMGTRTDTAGTNARTNNSRPNPPLPHYRTRVSVLLTFMTLVWFLSAHILVYASINTCRISSPHLWWLMFGIMCIMYITVVQLILIGFLALIVAPIIILSFNIFLYLIGRHPWQNPQIKPEIGKTSKSVVDQIPLVIYIPAPAENEGIDSKAWEPQYPPRPGHAEKSARTGRFKFLRKSKSKKDKKSNYGGGQSVSKKPEQEAWENNWEHGEYPFVILEGNRAVCSICLMDFEEPKRIGHSDTAEKTDPQDASKSSGSEDKSSEEPDSSGDKLGVSASENPTTHPVISPIAEEEVEEEEEEDGAEMPTLEDAGEGSQPLRLLECGHAFHKTCVDPWLLDVSGRCPVCQRPVEAPLKQNPRRRRT